MSPIEENVALLDWTMMLFDPPADVILTVGVWKEGATVVVTVMVTSLVKGGLEPESSLDAVTAVLAEDEDPGEPLETLVTGGMIPSSPVDKATIVPLENVTLPEPRTVDAESTAEPEFGGIIPESLVPVDVNVLLLVANEAAPELTVTETTMEPLADEAGGIMPEPPVELNAIALSPVANVATPEVTVSVTVTILPIRVGGIIPESLVEFEVSVLRLVSNDATPETTDLVKMVDLFAEGAGGITPKSPVLSAVAVKPETVNTNDPVENMVELVIS